jgi:hypothetical protein
MGRGVVVVSVVAVTVVGMGTPMTVVQSILNCVVVAVKNATTVVMIGHAKLMVVTPGQGRVT